MSRHIDLHVHTKVSKNIPFRMEYLDRTVAHAKRVGLHGFAMTEHFHSSDFWEATNAICDRFNYANGRLELPDFTILTGAELTVAEAADIILIGTIDALRGFDRHFGNTVSKGVKPPIAEIFEPCKRLGIITIAAHSTRPGKRLVKVGPEMLANFDALEINGKDVANDHVEQCVYDYAESLEKPLVGSSDAHYWPQVGAQRTLVPLQDFTLEGLRQCLEDRTTTTHTLPNIQTVVKISKRHKTIIKRRIKAEQEAAQRAAEQRLRSARLLAAAGN